MKITEILDQATEPLISFEIIPPLRGRSATQVYEIIDELIDFKPPFIDVTSHAADARFLEQPDGTFKKQVQRKRPGTLGLCAAIKYRYKVEAVPHLLCHGFTRQESEDALIELNYLGIDNVFAITGDGKEAPVSSLAGRKANKYSIELVEQIERMNRGEYEENILDSAASNFCVGVGTYPEKHPDAPNLAQDIKYLKNKVDAGADYAVTQMFFNNDDYFQYVNRCRTLDINIPIIPGIKLITRKSQITSLPRAFGINIPEDFSQAMLGFRDQRDCLEFGLDFALKQCEALLEAQVPAIHFYVMQDVHHIRKIVSTLKKV